MSVHVFRAREQPAHDFVVDLLSDGKPIRVKSNKRSLAYCRKCRKRRWRVNLLVQVYYDGTYVRCKEGHGCLADEASR